VTANFVLSLTGNPAGNPGLPLTGFTMSWKAPSGTKNASINGQISEDFAISLAAGGTITYSCSELSNIWTVSASAGRGNLACDQGSFSATGTLVDNAQTNALNLSFGLSGNQPDSNPLTINLNWTDSSGKPHAAALINEFSKGFGISLGAGQLLKFSCSAAETGNWSF